MPEEKVNDRKIINLMLAQTKDFVFFCISVAMLTVDEVFSLILLKKFADKVSKGYEGMKISYYVGILILLIFALAALVLLCTHLRSSITAKVAKKLSEDAYGSLLGADMQYLGSETIDIEISRAVKNSEYIAGEYIGKNVLPFIEMITVLFGFVLAGFAIQPVFMLFALIMVSLFAALMKTTDAFAERSDVEYQRNIDIKTKKIKAIFSDLKDIKLLNGQDYEKDRFDKLNENHLKQVKRAALTKTIGNTGISFLFGGIIFAAIIGFASSQKAKPGDFVFFFLTVPLMIIIVSRIIRYKLNYDSITEPLDELNKLYNLRQEFRNEPIDNLDVLQSIRFTDVSAGEPGKTILNNISFELRSGEKLGILCNDKKARKTIFDFLTRLDRPSDGQITFNNCDINKINPYYLRSLITALDDESHVFHNTVIENICYPYEFDEYKYNDALYRSGLKSIIPSLPEKERTVVGCDEAREFKRRLVFANAFFKDSKIFVVNDAAGEVGATVETELINQICKLKNKIVVIETDRAYLLTKCDKILIIEDGVTVEYGKYSELIKDKSSQYYKKVKTVRAGKAKIG